MRSSSVVRFVEVYDPATIPRPVLDALERLPAEERFVIRLRLGFDLGASLTYLKVGLAMGRFPAEVYRLQRRALERLRGILGDDEHDRLKVTLGAWFGRDADPLPLAVA